MIGWTVEFLREETGGLRAELKRARKAEKLGKSATTGKVLGWIGATILFIAALAGLSKHETARRGNTFGMAGMALALGATNSCRPACHGIGGSRA